MSPLRWTTKSTRKLADELTRQGHRVSADTVADLLREEGFSLQANAKTVEGAQHPDRDAQFRYINDQANEHIGAGDPVISVDTKKKELVGRYKNGGREWEPKGAPAQVKTHDFPDRQGPGKAIPYGIYDVAANTGWVSVGTDQDTAAFAVASIRRWWQARAGHDYPQATRLLITADAGGSNGRRTRAWKTELAALAAQHRDTASAAEDPRSAEVLPSQSLRAEAKPADRAHRPPSVRDVTGWITRHPDSLTQDETLQLKDILARCPELDATAEHVQAFAEMMNARTGHKLAAWIDSVKAGNLPELVSFVNGIGCDLRAVEAGLTLPFSSGAVEGQVNRIKMLKRQMFGRAGLALLRKRVLLAT